MEPYVTEKEEKKELERLNKATKEKLDMVNKEFTIAMKYIWKEKEGLELEKAKVQKKLAKELTKQKEEKLCVQDDMEASEERNK